jgi:rhamnosyltransferase
VGARWVDERSGRPGLFYRVRGGRLRGIAPTDEAPLRVDFLIASGTLLSMEAVTAIGPMREDLFIDHVDTEWCARALGAGWALYGVPRAQLRHALGDSQRRVWLGRWREVAVHSPLRNYYEVRNTIALLRSPHVPASWRCVHVVRLVQLLAFYGLLVAPRGQRWSAMARGLWHGVIGRWGRWDQSSRASAAR